MSRTMRSRILTVIAIAQLGAASSALASAAQHTLPAGTRLYLSLDELVSSAHGVDDVGSIVRCRVWRDVEDNGYVFIKANTPAMCRVDHLSRKGIAGQEGKVSVAAIETRTTDGQTINLSGGYHKAGAGSQVAVWTVGLLVFWPALFVTGKTAELPPGTVFDAATVNDVTVHSVEADATPVAVDLRGMGNGLSAEFLVDDFVKQPKHDMIRIKVSRADGIPQNLEINSVNGKAIDPIPLAVSDKQLKDGVVIAVAETPTKSLVKYFVKGINRFEISSPQGGQGETSEVIMNVQI